MMHRQSHIGKIKSRRLIYCNRQVLMSNTDFGNPSRLKLGFHCFGPKFFNKIHTSKKLCESRWQKFSDFDRWKSVMVSATLREHTHKQVQNFVNLYTLTGHCSISPWGGRAKINWIYAKTGVCDSVTTNHQQLTLILVWPPSQGEDKFLLQFKLVQTKKRSTQEKETIILQNSRFDKRDRKAYIMPEVTWFFRGKNLLGMFKAVVSKNSTMRFAVLPPHTKY